jgi:nucleoside-diphosphate-sugar epimerase
MRIAVTGAGGFVGRELLHRLREGGYTAIPFVRRAAGLPGEIVTGALEDADISTLARHLDGVDAIAHLAARTHILHDTGDALAAYRRVNVAGTDRVVRAATAAGISRLVYMSSIKVNGEETRSGRRFSGSDAPAPEDAYGQSKLEAERRIVASGLESVILRPPLVYGVGVGGNFARLVTAVRRGVPLPLGRVDNRRSLISVRNLADVTILALTRARAGGQILTVSDGEDVSTRTLVTAIGTAIDRPARLVPIPVVLLRQAGKLLGRGEEVRRLIGNLQLDDEGARTRLGWMPGEQLGPALRRMLGSGGGETR